MKNAKSIRKIALEFQTGKFNFTISISNLNLPHNSHSQQNLKGFELKDGRKIEINKDIQRVALDEDKNLDFIELHDFELIDRSDIEIINFKKIDIKNIDFNDWKTIVSSLIKKHSGDGSGGG